MDSITARIHITLFGLCLFLLLPMLASGLSLRRAQPGKTVLWGGLLALSVLLFLAAGWALVTLPRFDFVDRCRPAGTGVCLDGRLFSALRWEIFREQLLAIFIWLLLPLALGAGGLYWLFKK
ncbi:MAG: hypothetical protein Fur0043_22460 [Anaerolineales bacterium]